MGLDEDGLLSEEVDQYSSRIRERHKAHFGLLRRINRYCQAAKYRIKPHRMDGREIVAVSLMLKLLSDVQAAILLLEKGIVVQGRILLRAALEALFLLRNVCLREEFY